MQVQRIIASLEAGHGERNIAESERVPERLVRRVRQLQLDRCNRQMTAVGMCFSGFLDTVRAMHGEIDRGMYEELSA